MEKRVHFASSLAAERGILCAQDATSLEDQRGKDMSPPSSQWYTSKELRAFRRDINSYLDAEKSGSQTASQKGASKVDLNESCMRGLEIFASNVRRDLQKHYARSVIEAQRRIKACKKRKRSDEEEDSVLLQQVAEKYSQYARERAYQIAARDEVDCRLHEERNSSNAPPAKKQLLPHRKMEPTSRMHHRSRTSSLPSRGVPRTPSRLGMPAQGR